MSQNLRPTPTTNAEVFEHYFPYIKRLVRKAGISPQNVEDISMKLMTRFIERDSLGSFDPNFSAANGTPIRFESYISGFVFQYIRYLQGREQLAAKREPTYVDETVMAGGSDTDRLWMDVQGFYHEDLHDDLHVEDLVLRIHKQIDGMNSKHSCDFATFFDAVRDQIDVTGKINITQLAEKFGVTKTAVQNWMKQLRTQVTKALDE